MKNSLKILFFVVTLLVFSAHPVFALEVLISPNGTMSFYEGQVLGDSDEKESEERKEEKKEEKKSEERPERRSEEKRPERKEESKKQEMIRRAEAKIKTVRPEQKSQIRVKSNNEGNSVSIEKREEKRESNSESEEKRREQEREQSRERVEVKRVEEIKTPEIRVEMPMAPREEESEMENEVEDEPEFENEQESERERLKEAREQEVEMKKKTIEAVREERARRQEMFEIRTKSESEDDEDQETEIESRAIKAKLKAAEFVVDPTTNDVKIVTPSGEEHVLTHLPDQAREQMQAAGLLDEAQEGVEWGTGETELSIETKDDGTVVYKTKGKETLRFFGIPFSVPAEIELDDTTGQLTTNPVPESFWQRMLLRVSR